VRTHSHPRSLLDGQAPCQDMTSNDIYKFSPQDPPGNVVSADICGQNFVHAFWYTYKCSSAFYKAVFGIFKQLLIINQKVWKSTASGGKAFLHHHIKCNYLTITVCFLTNDLDTRYNHLVAGLQSYHTSSDWSYHPLYHPRPLIWHTTQPNWHQSFHFIHAPPLQIILIVNSPHLAS
jgi:hypothetical protein